MAQNVGSSPNFGGKKDALRPSLALVLIPTNKVVFNLLADINADVAALSLVK